MTFNHRLNDSTRDVQKFLNQDIQFDWISTDEFNYEVVFQKHNYKGLWVAPGSPYRNMNNALDQIRYAREHKIPTFGNCGGFQHMLIEFAKNECGIDHADHEETNPNGSEIIIQRLACSLKGEQETLTLIDETSYLYKIYGTKKLIGKYYCSYGLNENYIETLKSNGIRFTSTSDDGNFRSFEIDNHPFFIGTLFQPALTSTRENSNPMIIEFVKESIK